MKIGERLERWKVELPFHTGREGAGVISYIGMWNISLSQLESDLEDGKGLGSIAIETGTCQGHGTRVLARFFPRVVTIELSEALLKESQENLTGEGFSNIKFVHGNSANELPRILNTIQDDEVTFFFLDAHWSGDHKVPWKAAAWKGYGVDTAHLAPAGRLPSAREQCPLDQELTVIMQHCRGPAHILIDDMKNVPAEGPGLKDYAFPGEDWSHLSRQMLLTIVQRRLLRLKELTNPKRWLLSLGPREHVEGGVQILPNKRLQLNAESPLVSCIMITGHDARRHWLAKAAVRCYSNQDYPNKELVIVNHGDAPFSPTVDKGVVVINVPSSEGATLGDLRNIGLANASGEWIIQWDDDDWCAYDRISRQMEGADSSAANLLRTQIRYDFVQNNAACISREHGIDGTILYRRNGDLKYPSIRRREDTEFLKQFSRRCVLPNAPELYIRTFHGANTWDRRHIMGSLSDRINILALTESARQVLLTEMLPSYHVQNAGETSSEGIYVSSLYWPFLRCELRSAEPKVFGIGLSYCGFTQLAEVLSSFDIHTIEHPLGLFLIDMMEAAVGGSVSLDFERLDALYPGSVFIYLRPELNGWINRCLELFQRFDSPPTDIALSTYFETVRVALYGVKAPSASQLEKGYRMFEERVNNHFRDRTDDLLTLEINDHSVASRVRDFLSRAQVIDALYENSHSYMRGSATKNARRNEKRKVLPAFKTPCFGGSA